MYEATIRMLASLYAARGGYGGVRTWFGAISDVDGAPPPVAIATHLGLQFRGRAVGAGDFKRLDLHEAKAALAFLATNSLVHPTREPPPADVTDVIDAGLTPLGPSPRCYSNGEWHDPQRRGSWRPLTPATFDGGVICHNGDVGLAFWVDEED